MKRIGIKIVIKALLLGLYLLTFISPMDVKAITINLVSDKTWTVSDVNGNYLGNAQNICLTATAPSNCPPGATLYGYTAVAWTADLSSIPGATWIWAPGITGETSPATPSEFTFQKEFYLCGPPQGGTIFLAADNSAEVYLNGASTPVLTSASHSQLSSASIPAASLVQGLNIIQVKAKNGPGCGSNLYQCNPAGFVLGTSFSDALNSLPTCTDNGETFNVGDFEKLSCNAGETGFKSRPCVCIGSKGFWGPVSSTCAAPPPKCTGTNGKTFNAGETETLSCPTGQTGSQTRTCGQNGSWEPTTGTCVSPPVTCTGINGTTVNAGDTEARPCQAPKIGTETFTCNSNGNWDSTSNTCVLPLADMGDKCGSESEQYIATCPGGTECKHRVTPGHKPAWYCPFILFVGPACEDVPDLKTVDWYCDP